MVLGGDRSLSQKALDKMQPHLGLSESEFSYLENLVTLAESASQDAKLKALEKIQRSRTYQELNPKEFEVYRYLAHWYYVAIREMAGLPDFKLEPSWIQERLRGRLSLKEIEEAVSFLIENNYIELRKDGTAGLPDKDLKCVGGVYRLALAQFHREMLELAGRSLHEVPVEERDITGHTFAVPKEKLGEMRKILEEAREKIAKLSDDRKNSEVFHVALAAFPLTYRKPKKGES